MKTTMREFIDKAFVDYIINKNHESFTYGRLSGILLMAYTADAITMDEWDFIEDATTVLSDIF